MPTLSPSNSISRNLSLSNIWTSGQRCMQNNIYCSKTAQWTQPTCDYQYEFKFCHIRIGGCLVAVKDRSWCTDFYYEKIMEHIYGIILFVKTCLYMC